MAECLAHDLEDHGSEVEPPFNGVSGGLVRSPDLGQGSVASLRGCGKCRFDPCDVLRHDRTWGALSNAASVSNVGHEITGDCFDPLDVLNGELVSPVP